MRDWRVTKEIEVAEREQDKLFATGNPFELGSKARAAKEDLEKLSQEEGKLADMHNKLQTAYDGVNDKINEYSQKADEATASTSRLSRIGGMVGKAIGSIATFGKNAAKSLTGAKKSSSGFGLSLGTLVKYGFGIRSLSHGSQVMYSDILLQQEQLKPECHRRYLKPFWDTVL